MNHMRWNTRRLTLLATIGLSALLLPLCTGVGPVRASMDIELEDTPDILLGALNLHYDDPVADLLQVDGSAVQLKDSTGTIYNIQRYKSIASIAGTFSLRANISESGELTGGTVEIKGYSPAAEINYMSGTSLTGNITGLSYGAAQAPLKFLFEVTGGDAAGLFNSTAGLILHTQAFPGSFSGPFHNNGTAGDVGNVVPEPATIVLWPLLGIVGVGFEWRRRRRKNA